MLRDQLAAAITGVVGWPRVAVARRVLDRFGAADGGLLAAGIAYNAVLALIPIAIMATGLAGIFLTDVRSRGELIRSIVAFLPPLAGVVDEIVGGLSRVSPSLSLVGLVLAAWGTSRLFAALESAVAQMDAESARRSFARRTVRRIGSIVVLALLLIAAVVAAPILSIAVEMSGAGSDGRFLFDVLNALLPPLLAAAALAAIYRLIPVTRPSWRVIAVPAAVGAAALLVITRIFVFVTPRVFGANLVYGTLGAILVGLAWLDLVFTIVLIGAAWVRERTASSEPVVV